MGKITPDLSHRQGWKGFGDQDLLWPSKLIFGTCVGHKQKEKRTRDMSAPSPMGL